MATLSLPRRLSEAVGAWMHLEYCSYRAGVFSESSLKAVIGSVLSTVPVKARGTRAHAEYNHPALNVIKRPGAPNMVDFALILNGASINGEAYIETKWAGSSHCKDVNILKDFLRLANIKMVEPDAKCIFLMAGKSSDLAALFNSFPFRTTSQGKSNGFQLTSGEVKMKFDHLDQDFFLKASLVFSELIDRGMTVPMSLTICCHGIFPSDSVPYKAKFQAVAWEITQVDTPIIQKLWYRKATGKNKGAVRAK